LKNFINALDLISDFDVVVVVYDLVMGRDRISELPDGLLNHILMYLHIEESIRTSVLSSRWRKLWLKVPGLDVNVHDFPADGNLFESLMDKFLEVNRGRLQNFKLNYESNLYYLMDRFVPWIATVVDRGIQHLDVTATDCPPWTIDFMPANICKSKTLVSLKLVNVGLDTPKFVVSLPCLKIMHLEDIFYSPLIAENLISGCPVLEDLTIVRNHEDFLNFLRVMSQTLKNFRLTFDWGMGSNDFSVEIDAPGLKYMSFRDSQSDRIVVKNLSSLVKIDLDTEFNLKFGLGSPLEPEDLTKRDIIRDFLTGISSVKHMIISHPTLEVRTYIFEVSDVLYNTLIKCTLIFHMYHIHYPCRCFIVIPKSDSFQNSITYIICKLCSPAHCYNYCPPS